VNFNLERTHNRVILSIHLIYINLHIQTSICLHVYIFKKIQKKIDFHPLNNIIIHTYICIYIYIYIYYTGKNQGALCLMRPKGHMKVMPPAPLHPNPPLQKLAEVYVRNVFVYIYIYIYIDMYIYIYIHILYIYIYMYIYIYIYVYIYIYICIYIYIYVYIYM
jgi:hypothetical protein